MGINSQTSEEKIEQAESKIEEEAKQTSKMSSFSNESLPPPNIARIKNIRAQLELGAEQ